MKTIFKKTIIILLSVANLSLFCFANDSSGNIELSNPKSSKATEAWISIGRDAFELVKQENPTLLKSQNLSQKKSDLTQPAIVKISTSQINRLSKLMHQNYHRCPGFILHKTLSEAQSYANNFTQNKAHKSVNYTIDNSDVVDALLGQIVSSNMSATVTSLSDLNNRYYSEQSGADASSWLKQQWENISAGRSDIQVDFFMHKDWIQPSVITTIEGSTNPDEIVIIGGHLDSVNWTTSDAGSARAPGADDNASGIAVITETLMAMVASDYKPQRTIKLIGYAAEEVGLLGAKDIAQNFKSNSQNVVGVAQFDMTGFHGTETADIVFISDFTDADQNQFMKDLIDTYLPEISYASAVCGYGCSDHAAWNNLGYPASFPFESKFADSNETIHTSGDVNFDVEHSLNFVKLSLTFAAELAKGGMSGDYTPIVTTPPEPETIARSSGGGPLGILLLLLIFVVTFFIRK